MKKLLFLVLLICILWYFKQNKSSLISVNNKVAIILHVGNINVFKMILNDYPLFFNGDIDLYISCNSQEHNILLKKILPSSTVFLVKNKGMDIGPFFIVIDYLIKNKINYDYYIKLHTKTINKWRNGVIYPIYSNLNYFLSNKPSGIEMFGAEKYITDVNFKYNYTYITEILKRNYPEYLDTFLNYCISDNDINCTKKPSFVAGTIFVFNNGYLNFLKKIKNLNYEYSIMETKYITNDENSPRYTHSWEYLFGYLNYLNNINITPL